MPDLADVTVVIPNYNHAHFLPDCLNAVLSQSFPPREILIIDDASKDNSVNIIKDFQRVCSRIVLVENKINQGPIVVLNQAIKLAKGKYLAFCSADDHVLPGFMKEGCYWLGRYPNVGICCSDPAFFKDKKPYRFFRRRIAYDQETVEMSPRGLISKFLFSPLWVPSHASLYRKECVLKSGGFHVNLHHLSDTYLSLKIAFEYGIVYVPNSFGAFRISTQSYGAFLSRSLTRKFAIYGELFSLLSTEPKAFRESYRQSGVLGNNPADIIMYLLIHPSLWHYIPYCFFRKSCNFFRKLTNRKVKLETPS